MLSTNRLMLVLGGVVAATASIATVGALALAAPAGASTGPAAVHYSFTTLDNHKDLTFNQLLGINNEGLISGYFGSGMPGHPNKGYLLEKPYHQSDYVSENFPGSAQTQVTGLNNMGNTVGFWANAAGANFGFYTAGTHFHEVNFPAESMSSPPMDQLLGINDHGVAVGFYTNAKMLSRGYTYNIHTHKFGRVLIPGTTVANGPTLTAAAINNKGYIAGYYNLANGETVAFLKRNASFSTLIAPHSSSTQAFGVNNSGVVVGDYTVGTGKNQKMHGFVWTVAHGFQTVNDPHGVNTTTINGINNNDDLVGFYVDASGNTDGFLAKP
jgi:hypothetical protein